MRPFHTSDFLSLLPSQISDLLIHSLNTALTSQERIPPLHIATIHWIFSQWPDHFFAFRTAFHQQAKRSGNQKRFSPYFPHTFHTLAPQAAKLVSITQKRNSILRAHTPPQKTSTADTIAFACHTHLRVPTQHMTLYRFCFDRFAPMHI
jgi:hypothetical protein